MQNLSTAAPLLTQRCLIIRFSIENRFQGWCWAVSGIHASGNWMKRPWSRHRTLIPIPSLTRGTSLPGQFWSSRHSPWHAAASCLDLEACACQTRLLRLFCPSDRRCNSLLLVWKHCICFLVSKLLLPFSRDFMRLAERYTYPMPLYRPVAVALPSLTNRSTNQAFCSSHPRSKACVNSLASPNRRYCGATLNAVTWPCQGR